MALTTRTSGKFINIYWVLVAFCLQLWPGISGNKKNVLQHPIPYRTTERVFFQVFTIMNSSINCRMCILLYLNYFTLFKLFLYDKYSTVGLLVKWYEHFGAVLLTAKVLLERILPIITVNLYSCAHFPTIWHTLTHIYIFLIANPINIKW